MMLFFVGGLREIEGLQEPFRQTRDYRINDCSPREVVHDLEEPWERELRINQRIKRERTKQ